jgi:uncharacterized membrane protein|tara:strand:- start:1703 stop:2317 length:615 start_codon:yes stop_codon:yes gene_type:complete
MIAKLRNYFFAGLLVTAPIAITIYFVWIFVNFVDSKVTQFFPEFFFSSPIAIPGSGLLLFAIFMILIGWFTASFLGRIIVRFGEKILGRVPVIRGIYTAIKQIFGTVLKKQSDAFRQVVLIEYPRKGSWAMGFLTGSTKGEVQKVTKETMVNVFLPTTPNPTSGFLLFVPKKDIRPLKMSVDQGIKMIISAGIITPSDTGKKKS